MQWLTKDYSFFQTAQTQNSIGKWTKLGRKAEEKALTRLQGLLLVITNCQPNFLICLEMFLVPQFNNWIPELIYNSVRILSRFFHSSGYRTLAFNKSNLISYLPAPQLPYPSTQTGFTEHTFCALSSMISCLDKMVIAFRLQWGDRQGKDSNRGLGGKWNRWGRLRGTNF